MTKDDHLIFEKFKIKRLDEQASAAEDQLYNQLKATLNYLETAKDPRLRQQTYEIFSRNYTNMAYTPGFNIDEVISKRNQELFTKLQDQYKKDFPSGTFPATTQAATGAPEMAYPSSQTAQKTKPKDEPQQVPTTTPEPAPGPTATAAPATGTPPTASTSAQAPAPTTPAGTPTGTPQAPGPTAYTPPQGVNPTDAAPNASGMFSGYGMDKYGRIRKIRQGEQLKGNMIVGPEDIPGTEPANMNPYGNRQVFGPTRIKQPSMAPYYSHSAQRAPYTPRAKKVEDADMFDVAD